LGLPLWRASFSVVTKHPEVLWLTLQWLEGHGISVVDREHRAFDDPPFTESPVALLLRGVPSVRVRLLDDALPFPICRDLRQQGGTDYYVQALRFSSGEVGYVSWSTRAPEGFSDEAIGALDALAPFLTCRIELESAYHATRTLLDVYLGHNAARRVMDGAFRRGEGVLTHAAIWFCDLRDFTAMSDSMTPANVVQMLDAYFDRVAGAVTARGGEVLKFVGDAILAVFPTDLDVPAACGNALRAADEALTALQRLNQERAPESPLAIGIALHVGEVMYGNIGSKERLDFTVISSTVNETCRLEALCKPLRTPLTLSAAFVNTLEGEQFVDLGEHSLKGVSAKARVFTLEKYEPSER
jgi:adenylate cyclase